MNYRITKLDKNYQILKHAIWVLLDYYMALFKWDVCYVPEQLHLRIAVDGSNVTHFYVQVKKNETQNFSMGKIKSILNEYLNVVLLKDYPELQPFSIGKGVYDTMDCIYICDVADKKNCYLIDIIYVDSPIAFRAVRDDQKIKGV